MSKQNHGHLELWPRAWQTWTLGARWPSCRGSEQAAGSGLASGRHSGYFSSCSWFCSQQEARDERGPAQSSALSSLGTQA